MKKFILSLVLVMAAVAVESGQENLSAFRFMYQAGTAPVAGTNCIQTLTVGAVSAGTFTITFDNATTAPITWVGVNATLVANIDAALEALNPIGTGGVTTAAGTIVNGANGTVTVTHTGNRAKQVVPVFTTNSSGLTGGTITAAITTAGVEADCRICPKGSLVVATDTGVWYSNTGTPPNPTWVTVGSQ